MPKIVDHEANRAELLEASLAVVARVGYGSISMKQLAKSLGVSTGSIYLYFENKEDWFVSLTAHHSAAMFALLAEEVPVDVPVAERARAVIEHMDRYKEYYANIISVVTDYVRMPEKETSQGAEQLTAIGDQFYSGAAELFETDEQTARVLMAHLVGVITTNRLDPRGIDIKAHLPVVQTILEQSAWVEGSGAVE